MNPLRKRQAWAVIVIYSFSLFACEETRGKELSATSAITMEGNRLNTYLLGRFSVLVQDHFKPVARTHKLRACEIDEFVWPKGDDRQQIKEGVWHERIKNIQELQPPRGVKNVVIEERLRANQGIMAVFYYGNYAANDEGYWDLLLDAGPVGVWVKFDGLLEGKEKLYSWVHEVAAAYKYQDPAQKPVLSTNRYHLKYGTIDLSYLAQEQTYARFESPKLDMKLEIEMQETPDVEETGLTERYDAAIATGYALGVEMDKIRGQKRIIAGLKGEDVIVRMKDKYDTVLKFAWEYPGEEDSGERPEIQITMESPDGALKEKIKVWDAILDSFTPMYPRTK